MADGGVSGVTGDYGPLATLRRQVSAVGNGSFKRSLLAQLAQVAANQIYLGFARERDPYGKKWPARKDPGDGHPLLRESGRLYLAAQRIVPTSDGLHLAGGTPVYAAVHQYGYAFEARTQTNALGRNGRIRSRASARRSRAASVGVSFTRRVGWTLPRRQFLPEEHTGGLGPIWTEAFERTANRAVTTHFGL